MSDIKKYARCSACGKISVVLRYEVERGHFQCSEAGCFDSLGTQITPETTLYDTREEAMNKYTVCPNCKLVTVVSGYEESHKLAGCVECVESFPLHDDTPRYDTLDKAQRAAGSVPALCKPTAPLPDSGTRRTFETGAVRDGAPHKGRFDLLVLGMLRRDAVHVEQGAEKYDANNWRKGILLSSFFNSAMRHLLSLYEGDTSEDHAAACRWNVAGYVWTLEQIAAGKLPDTLDDRWKG